jgi:hypothetical protein
MQPESHVVERDEHPSALAEPSSQGVLSRLGRAQLVGLIKVDVPLLQERTQQPAPFVLAAR